MKTNARLEELRAALRAENISYGELAELQGMVDLIDPSDVELLEAAGVDEFDDENDEPALGTPEWVRERALRGLVALKESDSEVVYEVLTTLSEYEAS